MPMTISREQIIDALIGEHEAYVHSIGIEDGDMTRDECTDYLKELSYEQLVEETSTDKVFTLEEFVSSYN